MRRGVVFGEHPVPVRVEDQQRGYTVQRQVGLDDELGAIVYALAVLTMVFVVVVNV